MILRRSLVAATALAAISLAPLSASAQTLLKAADVHPAGYSNVVALESMGKKLEAATNGRYKMQMFPSGVLGAEKEMIEQTQVGAIAISRISLGALGQVVPEVNAFNLPFVFRNSAHMRAVIDGAIGQEILDKITNSPARLVALGWMDAGGRNLYTKKIVKTPADLKGMKIRMMGNPVFLDTMNAMGGNGIAMGYGEVYSALQTNVIDGAENNPPALFTTNQYSAGIKFFAKMSHLIIPDIFVMSKITWNKMTPADQAVVIKLSRETQMEQRALWDDSVTEYTAKLKAAGVEFVDLDQKPFYDATAPVRAKYGASFTDLLKRIEAVN